MAKRILLAGILGGLALFLWGGLSHQALGLGDHGLQPLTQPGATEAIKAAAPIGGFYYFPQADSSGRVRPEDRNGPWGVLVFHPTGATSMMTRQLVNECILNIGQGLLVAFLLSMATRLKGYASRVGFVVLAGFWAAGAMSIEYWNWFGFPANYTEAMLADRAIGFLVVGLVVAAIVKPNPANLQAVPAKAA